MGGGGVTLLEFGRSVNPIQTRGADYAPHTTASPHLRIQKAIYTSDIVLKIHIYTYSILYLAFYDPNVRSLLFK